MIRTAIVGTGGIAGICHVPALRAQAHRARIVAAVDVDAARAEEFAAEHGIPAVYTDLHTMLEEQSPDVVHLCTPPFLHAEQAVACLESQAWVWCEKPVALSLAELDRIRRAEGPARAGAVFQHRFGSGPGTCASGSRPGPWAVRSSRSASRRGTATTPTTTCPGAAPGRRRAVARPWGTASTRWT